MPLMTPAPNSDTLSETSSDAGSLFQQPEPAGTPRVEEKFTFADGYERKKTAAYLCFGSIMGCLGFLFAGLIGLVKFFNPSMSELYHNAEVDGGWVNGYFPATVSEMVHDPEDPAGKCFFAFASIGAWFIFLSWYPWRLRNVYMGDSTTLPGLPWISWSMFRQFIPPTGMMIVASVTTTPAAQANPLDLICVGIHLTGALMFFAGYCAAESFAIGWGPFPLPEVTRRTTAELELRWRRWILTGIVWCYTAFCMLQGILLMPLDMQFGHNDVWEPRPAYDEFGALRTKMCLIDTATGAVLALKIASYTSEVLGGLLLIASHLLIWGFCSERQVDLQDELWKVA